MRGVVGGGVRRDLLARSPGERVGARMESIGSGGWDGGCGADVGCVRGAAAWEVWQGLVVE